MNTFIKQIRFGIIALIGLSLFGCTDDFEKFNANPASLPSVKPEQMLYQVELKTLTAGHCWSSIYASKYRWMQYGTGIWGYGSRQYDYFSPSIGGQIYNEYNAMGSYVTNIGLLASKSEKPESYTNLNQVSRIILIAKAIQTSDLYGSLAYSQAWKAREDKIDDKSLTPEFETQEQLSEVWNNELKTCINNLQSKLGDETQASLKGHDRAYNGDTKQWIKAANALRLRLASRLWKRNPDMALTIAKEVLAAGNAENLFGSHEDGLILWFDELYTNINGGDWHSVKDMEVASFAIMDYLNRNDDPRKRIYFVINNLTPENIEKYNSAQTDTSKLIPTDFSQWEGCSVSYDNWKNDKRLRRDYLRPQNEAPIDMRAANKPQVRLWKGNDNNGNGGNWAPIMTYADFAFLAAEFVLRGNVPSAKSAQQWYEDGVTGSLAQWNMLGRFCDIENYEAFTEEEKEAFLAKPDIKWDESKALEQIYAQTYVEHYKNIDEMYAFWKRTNYPNWDDAVIVKFERPSIFKVEQNIPRRVKFDFPNQGVHNSENLIKRLETMKADPQFGEISNEYGRLWWDKE